MNTKPVPVPNHKLGQAMLHMVEQGKRPCFRIEGIRITMASEISANPGYLYIKGDDWGYIGKITPYGLMKIQHPNEITDIQKTYVLAAIHEPEKIAMTNGKITGTCCCCGRTLTNPLSIELGIGPICRGFWFPESITPTDTVAMLETLDSIESLGATPEEVGADKLLEDLGSLEHVTVAEPVMELVKGYKALNHTQQMIFFNMLEKIEGGPTDASD